MNLTNLIETLQIVAKHIDNKSNYVCAEHDVIFLPIPNSKELPAEDVDRLFSIGAFKSEESGTWAVFT